MIDGNKKISKAAATRLYEQLLLPRLIEEKMLNLLRQNKISKWFSGIGQEAIAVGTTSVLKADDHILPMHRNLGVFTTRNVPFYPLFCQLFGKLDGFTQGRDRSFHFGLPEYNIFGMISHLAATMPVADGLALAAKIRNEDKVAVSFCGDGATSEGDFHEALNLAAVWKLPVIFIIENNGYGLSTPVSEQYACKDLADRAAGYGMEGMVIDGNDIFAVQKAVTKARTLARKGKPVLIEAKTFRMRGHEEASGTFYVSDKLFETWAKKDPVLRFERWMIEHNLADGPETFQSIAEKLKVQFDADLKRALECPDPEFELERELVKAGLSPAHQPVSAPATSSVDRRFVDAIQAAHRQAFDENRDFLLMGQDIAEYGGVFKVSEGFLPRYGKDRIRNTPIIESGAIGAAIGLAMEGFKPVVEMQFADFISCGYNQIVNNLAKSRYRWTPDLNVTIRAPHGAGVGAGPFHSQSVESWFMSLPGVRVLVPGTVQDAQDMLYTALYDPNPVLFFEHKKLYRSIREEVPERCQFTNLDKAAIRREGTHLSLITYGYGLVWANRLSETLASEGIETEIIDLRSLAPIDWDTLATSLQKTHRALLLQEPSEMMGPMSEISSGLMERCFEFLDAPIMRCSSLNMPVPFNRNLEAGYLADARLEETARKLLAY